VTLAASSPAPERIAGQFAFVSFESGPTREQHPFTISSGAHSDVRFSIKAAGDFTEGLLSGIPDTSIATVEGPYGAFDYRRGQQHQLWLAGGIGITPFLSMAEDLDAETRVFLVWSVHDEREAVYELELSRVSGEKQNFDWLVHSTSERGHLDISASGFDFEPNDYSVFICGPLPMRRALVRQLKALGVNRGQIHFEEFRLR
jgi:predicted ferric reductase